MRGAGTGLAADGKSQRSLKAQPESRTAPQGGAEHPQVCTMRRGYGSNPTAHRWENRSEDAPRASRPPHGPQPPHAAGKGWGVPRPPSLATHVSRSSIPRLGVSQRRTGSNSRCWRNAINKAEGREEAAGGRQVHRHTGRCSPSSQGWAVPVRSQIWGERWRLQHPAVPRLARPPSPCSRGITPRFLHQPGQE